MAEIIRERIVERPAANSHHVHDDTARRSNGMGFLLGMVLLLIVLYLLFVYGLPAIRQAATPNISVPEKVDVNINTPTQQ